MLLTQHYLLLPRMHPVPGIRFVTKLKDLELPLQEILTASSNLPCSVVKLSRPVLNIKNAVSFGKLPKFYANAKL